MSIRLRPRALAGRSGHACGHTHSTGLLSVGITKRRFRLPGTHSLCPQVRPPPAFHKGGGAFPAGHTGTAQPEAGRLGPKAAQEGGTEAAAPSVPRTGAERGAGVQTPRSGGTSPGDTAPGHQPPPGRRSPGPRGKGLPDHVRSQCVQGGPVRGGRSAQCPPHGVARPSVPSKSFPAEKDSHSSRLTRAGDTGIGSGQALPAPPSSLLPGGHVGFRTAFGAALWHVAGRQG